MGLFTKILADEDNGFCRALEELALKKQRVVFVGFLSDFDDGITKNADVSKNIDGTPNILTVK